MRGLWIGLQSSVPMKRRICSPPHLHINNSRNNGSIVDEGAPKSHCSVSETSKSDSISVSNPVMIKKIRSVVPTLNQNLYKGNCGRLCVVGGCTLYTGAPYYSAISALRTGADLVHVMCEESAANVIKSYSPDLIVHPILDTNFAMEEFDKWLPRFDSVVIGPGLGRSQCMSGRISNIIDKVKQLNIPLVIDADGLWHISNCPQLIINYTPCVITPNAVEFVRLAKSVLNKSSLEPSADVDLVRSVAIALGGVTILHKGFQDVITDGEYTEVCGDQGSFRRCGGQGDVLSGCCAVFLHWAISMKQECPEPGASILAAYAASRLVRATSSRCFSLYGRSFITTDVISQLGYVFSDLFENETFI